MGTATEDSLHERIAAEVRAETARRRLNQTELAGLLGLSQAGASRRLRGVTPFTVDELDLLGRHLGVSVVDLVTRADRTRVVTLPRRDSNTQPTGKTWATSRALRVALPWAA